MEYKGIEIRIRKSGKYELTSPVNGTNRIFKQLETAKRYIDRAKTIDENAEALRH